MHNPNRPLISSAATGIGGIVLVLIGAPWWLTALAFTCFFLVLVVAVIESVFPQEPPTGWPGGAPAGTTSSVAAFTVRLPGPHGRLTLRLLMPPTALVPRDGVGRWRHLARWHRMRPELSPANARRCEPGPTAPW